tara:strand:- start:110 stop:241 length:132 start_codon:yes stop_codon:yes gene_type:complete
MIYFVFMGITNKPPLEIAMFPVQAGYSISRVNENGRLGTHTRE